MRRLLYILFFLVYSLPFTVNSQTTLYSGGYTSTTNTGGSWVTTTITTIDITAYINIAITVDFGEIGDLENQDRFSIDYQIDGSGPWTTIGSQSNDICTGVCGGSSSGSVSGINGTTSITIRTMLKNGVDETWWHDNLTVTGIPDPLPVELVYFIADTYNNYLEIKWKTASEIQNDYFQVERSTDGINYTGIYFIAGAGNSTTPIGYSIQTQLPTTNSYYRLKQVDFSGTYEYSKIIYISPKLEIKTIIGEFDLTGRPIGDNYSGVVIIRYSDGTYKKIIK